MSPVHEHIIAPKENFGAWWQRYQIVSYKIGTRGGDEAQLSDMIKRCNKVGVRVYIDLVPNHMTGGSNGRGWVGSEYYGHNGTYPAVPYGPEHFNMNIEGRCTSTTGKLYSYSKL